MDSVGRRGSGSRTSAEGKLQQRPESLPGVAKVEREFSGLLDTYMHSYRLSQSRWQLHSERAEGDSVFADGLVNVGSSAAAVPVGPVFEPSSYEAAPSLKRTRVPPPQDLPPRGW